MTSGTGAGLSGPAVPRWGDDPHDGWRREVRRRLGAADVRQALAELQQRRTAAAREADPRPLYRRLGQAGLLGVGWPRAYGGGGRTYAEEMVVAEELHRAGVPDMLHVYSVQILGPCLLRFASAAQLRRRLPPMARGESFGVVLLTEPQAGSDLAALASRAMPTDGGYRLRGRKIFGLEADRTDFALVAARTAPGASRYQGISLFLVDLDAPGVHRSVVPSSGDLPFHRVEFDDVALGPDALLGPEGQGWSLLSTFLALERTGIDYVLRAERWYEAATAGVGLERDERALAEAARRATAVAASRLYTWQVIADIGRGEVDEATAAAAKYQASEVALDVAGWAVRLHGPAYAGRGLARDAAGCLEAAYREAPGLVLSAGASELLLELLGTSSAEVAAGSRAARPDFTPDPVLQRLRAAVARRLGDGTVGGFDEVRALLRDLGLLALEAPVEAGGLDLGVSAGAVVCEELGYAAAPNAYAPVALAVDALACGGAAPGRIEPLAAGDCAVAPVGLEALAPPGAAPSGQLEALARGGDGLLLRGSGTAEGLQATAPGGMHGREGALLCVAARAAGRLALLAVPAGTSGWRREASAVPELDVVTFDGLEVCAGEVACLVAEGSPAEPCPVLVRARLRQAAYLLGLARGVHNLAVAHTAARRQFGRPLAEQPVVRQTLGRGAVALRVLQTLVYRAAGALDAGAADVDAGTAAPDGGAAVLAFAAETATACCAAAVHLHGARGLTRADRPQRYHRSCRIESVRLAAPEALWAAAGAHYAAARAPAAPAPAPDGRSARAVAPAGRRGGVQ